MFETEIVSYLRRIAQPRFMPKAALIDMDGTLYDSMPLHARAWARLATEQGWPFANDTFFLHEGRTGVATIDILAGPGTLSEEERHRLYHLKTLYFNELPQPDKMPGAEDMLHNLGNAGIRRVLVTGSGQASVISRISHDFPECFYEGDFITSGDYRHGKPDPEPFIMGMNRAGAQPWQAIVVENAPLGVEAGHRSGAFTIAVNTGPIDPEVLRDAGADLLFRSMSECAAAIPSLLHELDTISL